MAQCKHNEIYYTRYIRVIYKRTGDKQYTFTKTEDESSLPMPPIPEFVCSKCGEVIDDFGFDFIDEEDKT